MIKTDLFSEVEFICGVPNDGGGSFYVPDITLHEFQRILERNQVIAKEIYIIQLCENIFNNTIDVVLIAVIYLTFFHFSLYCFLTTHAACDDTVTCCGLQCSVNR